MSLSALMIRWKEADQTITEAIDAYVDGLADLAKGLGEQVADLPRASNRRLAMEASLETVHGMLRQAGWRSYIDPLRSLYGDVAQAPAGILAELGISPRPSQIAIARALSFSVGQLEITHAQVAAALLPQLQAATVAPISSHTMAKSIREAVGGLNPRARAKAIVNTASAGLSNEVAATAMDELPEGQRKYWLYLGPSDARTRPFCRALAGRAIPADQLKKLRNGSGLPVQRYGGGYQCRHSLIPITERIRKLRKIQIADRGDLAQAQRGGR